MNKTRYVIKYNQAVGRKFPLGTFAALWLLMDRLHAPQWLYGIYWFIVIIVAVVIIFDTVYVTEKYVDVQDLLMKHYFSTNQDKEVKS